MKISCQKNLYKFIFLFLLVYKINSREVQINIKGKIYTINSPNVIDEDSTPSNSLFESSSLDEPVFIVTGKSTLIITGKDNENTLIKKNIDISNINLDSEKKELGLYSAIIAIGSSTVIIENAEIETNCNGCIGITLLENAQLNFFDAKIKTYKDNSPAFYLNFGSILVSDSIDITTEGNDSPGVLLKGESKITILNSNFKTKGTNSSLFYSQGSVYLSSTEGNSEKSNIIVNELINSNNCFIMTSCKFQGLEGVKIYSKENFAGHFGMRDSNLTLNNENKEIPMFDIIDSMIDFSLDDDKNIFEIKNDFFINARSSEELKNGADVSINMEGSTVSGLVKTDSQSNVHFTCEDKSRYSGIKTDGNVDF